MMTVIDNIMKFVFPIAEAIDHPFVIKQAANVRQYDKEDVEQLDEKIVETTWGQDKVVKAKHESFDGGEAWELDNGKKTGRLKSIDLDEFDWHVIREKDINPNSFKLLKPYIVANWKYKDIAPIIGYSLSWVQDIAPRVKEAIKLRKKAPIV